MTSPDLQRQAGTEIQITAEMIEAGVRALREETTLAEFPCITDHLSVGAILASALRAYESAQ